MTQNPYGTYVGTQDPVALLEQSSRRIAEIGRQWSADAFDRSYAPGKWSGRLLLIHLAQMEMVFSTRLRFALAENEVEVQPFDQDPWMAVEQGADGPSALEAYVALRAMNLGICRRLTPEERRKAVRHPQFGIIDVEWLMTQVAGHELHHLPQLQEIVSTPGS